MRSPVVRVKLTCLGTRSNELQDDRDLKSTRNRNQHGLASFPDSRKSGRIAPATKRHRRHCT